MKFFTIIFSIYLVAISFLPCGDAYNDCNNSKPQTETTQDHSHKNDHNDICSPFCTCACCSTTVNFAFQPLKIKEAKLIFAETQKFPIWDFNFVSNFYGNIWQPPKINA